MAEAEIGIIGGSGLYAMEGLEQMREVRPETPFGRPSDAIILAQLAGRRVAFLPRHGRGHTISPSELNSRANIYALKSLGVRWVISVSAVGSLREHIPPLDLVVPDQLFDRTRSRPSTFFGEGIVAHVGMAQPFCPDLSGVLVNAARALSVRVHDGGTYVCIEGPQFSTIAESNVYRQWGMDIIGMTALPEARLAREAEICYATLAFVTDFDVWHASEEPVTVEMVIANLQRNVATAKGIIQTVVPQIGGARTCPCANALENTIMTAPSAIPQAVKERLALLIGKYVR